MSRLVFLLMFLAVLAARQVDLSAETLRIDAQGIGTPDAPRRSISDITAVLVQDRENLKAVEAAIGIAEQLPPEGAKSGALARFFRERARAAHFLGRFEQEVADYRAAIEHSRLSGNDQGILLWDLGRAEALTGNYNAGIAAINRALDLFDDQYGRGFFVAANSVLAMLHARGGDVEKASAALKQAQRYRGDIPNWPVPTSVQRLLQAGLEAGEAAVLDATGDYEKAERLHRKALGRLSRDETKIVGKAILGADAMSPRVWFDNIALGLSQNLRHQGRLIDAENAARSALLAALRSHGRNSGHTAAVIENLGSILLEQGRIEEAAVLARTSLDIFDQARVPEGSLARAAARARIGEALVIQGRWTEAREEFDAAANALAGDPRARAAFTGGNLSWALALIYSGQPERTGDLLQAAFDKRVSLVGQVDYSAAEMQGILALANALSGDETSALPQFRTALPVLVAGAAKGGEQTSSATATSHRLALILEGYIELLLSIRGTALEAEAGVDINAETFRVADVARNSSVQRALAQSAARSAAGDRKLGELARQAQDAEKRMVSAARALTTVLARPENQADPKLAARLRGQIETLRSKRDQLGAKLAVEFPAYADLIGPPPATIDQVRQQLRDGEALVATYVGARRSYAWAVSKDGPSMVVTAEIDQAGLSTLIKELRRSLEPGATTIEEVPAFDLVAARRIYELFLKPLEAAWQSSSSLIVVPHGPLGQIPFALLPTGRHEIGASSAVPFERYKAVPWLLRTHAITHLPTVASLGTLRSTPAPSPDRRAFAGFGDPWFSKGQATEAQNTSIELVAYRSRAAPIGLRGRPDSDAADTALLSALPRLPDTAAEIMSLAKAMNADIKSDVFLGKRASEELVKSMNLSDRRVIVFATHGLVPGDVNGLAEPALALSAPEVTGGEADGLLTLSEVLSLELDADWVVLSACNTGSAAGAGAEAVSGLGRAFFYAGTRALLVSHWPVETTSARKLTTELFRRQSMDANLGRAAALQQSALQLIDEVFANPESGAPLFSYAHPIFWAPLALIGDGGI